MTIMFNANKKGGVFRHPAGYDEMVQELRSSKMGQMGLRS